MDTRELFERLIADEPPMSVAAPAVSASGRAASRRRWAGRGTGAVAVAAVVAVGVVQISHEGNESAPSNAGAAPSSVPESYDGFAFTSQGLVSSASARSYRQLLQAGASLGPLGPQTSAAVGTAAAGVPAFFQAQIQLASNSPTVFLDLVVADKATAKKQFGGALAQGPCVAAMPNASRSDKCEKQALPGGATLWTSENLQSNGDAASSAPLDVMERAALLVAGDGSAVRVEEFAELPNAGDDQPLPATGALSEAQVTALATAAARAWLDATPQPSPSPVTPSQAGVTFSGPALANSFAFATKAQISAANDRLFAELQSKGGGAAALTSSMPLWDTAPIVAGTAFVGDQVTYPVAGGTAQLRVVIDDSADAASRYNGLLSQPLCAQLKPNNDGSFAHCVQTLVPGATVYTYERVEAVPGQITGRAQDSVAGPATYERDAILVTGDGSALDVQLQVLGGANDMPLPLTGDLGLSAKDLAVFALNAAIAWQNGGPTH